MGEKPLNEQPKDGKMESRGGDYIQGKDGKMNGSMPSSSTDVDGGKNKYTPSPQRNKKVKVQLSAKRYARLCGTFGKQYPGLEKGELRKIRDKAYQYTVRADGYGGFETIDVRKIK